MIDTIESVTAMRASKGCLTIPVHKIIGKRHSLIFEDGYISKITFCNTCASVVSIGTSCVTCACSSGSGL